MKILRETKFNLQQHVYFIRHDKITKGTVKGISLVITKDTDIKEYMVDFFDEDGDVMRICLRENKLYELLSDMAKEPGILEAPE